MKISPPCTKPAGGEASRWWDWRNLSSEHPASPGRCCEAPPWYHINHFHCGLRKGWGGEGKKVFEVCQWVSASLSHPEPYCKTSSVLAPPLFIAVGWPWKEGARQIFILLGEGKLAGETPQLGGNRRDITPSRSFRIIWHAIWRITYLKCWGLQRQVYAQPKMQHRVEAPDRARFLLKAVVSLLRRCCSQPCSGLLPFAKHRAGTKRQLLP